ncbi:unnamed protein product [Phytophthora fragariaefolia]|uniref:Unnamed protein product n=1 Tax=Phytophthora fragariaefolia TaxID=1490495 RepID=A0A9W6Y2D0_9STRA|nr:unnamed protein product [Phytophthora fragariaefolia]
MQSDVGGEANNQETNNWTRKMTNSTLVPIKREQFESSFQMENTQRLRNIETWGAKCSTEHLGVPNALRTAICFDVLTKISMKFPRFQNLTQTTRGELEKSTYMNGPSNPSEEVAALGSTTGFSPEALKGAFARRAYFTELKDVLTEKETLEQRL